MSGSLPRLYSFRRCPYAMRARLGLLFAELKVELREVVLKNKPAQMLAISPKGTVPVLELAEDDSSERLVIEESRQIVEWALRQNDPKGLLNIDLVSANTLIDQNDNEFKHWLDRYKYADRHPELTQSEYREQGEVFLQVLEQLLAKNRYLLGSNISIADIGIMPFVRQFAHVDQEVFYSLPYPNLQQWLRDWLEHPVFQHVMIKFQPWQEGHEIVVFP
ncbi:glutathione S-transferase [Halopseudomonas bauzanensis]|uniref:Glutathione S-transferase n=1 Tax=Halopseudomonas bauzanensis TaxID=653930 RepID=A0A1I4LXC8_9GAMM|nr:glutathione S-transferase [Halopseudomonas bauzanensis]SER84398.1 glutathione S-transferase [Halopseudomonas bauzanensis]SFL95620.1 glutathione S-transferase [Halopseudomonas bauzanensis]